MLVIVAGLLDLHRRDSAHHERRVDVSAYSASLGQRGGVAARCFDQQHAPEPSVPPVLVGLLAPGSVQVSTSDLTTSRGDRHGQRSPQ